MKLYVVAATIIEIEPLIENGEAPAHKLMISGIGAPATCYQLTKLAREDRPDLVIQAGIAGAFDADTKLGEVRIVKQDRFADLGVEENKQWLDVFDLGLSDSHDEPYKNGWLINETTSLNRFNLPFVNGITINEITTNDARIRLLKEKYDPYLESMEGAALHFVCLQEKIPFVQLRAISNHIGERDKSKWEMKNAIRNLNRELLRLMESVTGEIHRV